MRLKHRIDLKQQYPRGIPLWINFGFRETAQLRVPLPDIFPQVRRKCKR